MVVNIVLGRGGHIWSTGLLLVGIAYGVANIGVFIVTISAARIATLRPRLHHFSCFCRTSTHDGPNDYRRRILQEAWLARYLLGFATWIGCVGFAHMWVIAAASASV